MVSPISGVKSKKKKHRTIANSAVYTDTDIMSGMLTAINDFVQDSFQSTGDLGAIDYGDNTVVLQRGKNCYLAAVVKTLQIFWPKIYKALALYIRSHTTCHRASTTLFLFHLDLYTLIENGFRNFLGS